jgi:hypothetical protein
MLKFCKSDPNYKEPRQISQAIEEAMQYAPLEEVVKLSESPLLTNPIFGSTCYMNSQLKA